MKHGFFPPRVWRGVVFRVFATILPLASYAGLLVMYGSLPTVGAQEEFSGHLTSLNIPLLASTGNPNPKLAVATPSNIVYGVALASDENPIADEHRQAATSDQISTYVVREGDSLSEIATMFNVSINTIRWANDLSGKSTIRPGQTLVILPVTGIRHTVKKGDTVKSIAKKYKGDLEEIMQYNGIDAESELAVGTEVIIPEGEIVAAPTKSSATSATKPKAYSGPTYAGYYMRPVSGIRTQGLHGHNGVDLGSPVGTPIYAAAAGEVIISQGSGWNGGYGNYVVIKHDNGTQTLYAHNSSNTVSVGSVVAQGDLIGYVGMTGRSTGAHVHFEVRGATNPF